ncbi:MAG: MobA/MobL family protein [Desulfotalea sp.]
MKENYYHHSVKVISRSNGSNCLRKAAYNSRSRLVDKYTGKSFDHSKKDRTLFSAILIPDDSPVWLQDLVKDRSALWSEIEKKEQRKDSQLAREVVVALPHSLNARQHEELLIGFVEKVFVTKGMVADISIHQAPVKGDQRNIHAHILLTMRDVGEKGFTAKNRSWNDRSLVQNWRESWARDMNKAFEKIGLRERVDHRSLKEQGLDREATRYKGLACTELERKKSLEATKKLDADNIKNKDYVPSRGRSL